MHHALLPAALLLFGLIAAPATHGAIAATSATRTVTTTADSGAGSLRQQLTLAQPGDMIAFDAAVFATPQTIELSSELPPLANNLVLQAPGANLLTLRRADAAPAFRILRAPPASGTVTIAGLTIANGYAPASSDDGNGGGVVLERTFLVDGVHFTGNRADGSGAGMLTNTVGGTISNSTFSNNVAGSNGSGGGLSIQPAATPVRIVNSTFSGNSGITGGAIEVFAFLPGSSEVEMIGLTIHGNISTAPLGATSRAAVVIGASGVAISLVTMRDTLFSNNDGLPIYRAQGTGVNNFVSADFNLADANIPGFLDGPNDLLNAHPGLAPLADNGGPTPTHALLPDSDAIDAGSNVGSVVLTDQRGFARTVDLPTPQTGDSDATDIGAFESNPGPPLEAAIFADGFEGG